MKLHEIKLFEVCILETAMNILFDVIWWIRLHQRGVGCRGPMQILRRHFGGCVEFLVRVRSNCLAQQILAAAVAISVGSIEKSTTCLTAACKEARDSSSSELDQLAIPHIP